MGKESASRATKHAVRQGAKGGGLVKLSRLLSTWPQPPDIGPALWEAFDARLAATRLTERQRRFVVEYIKVPSGASAARAAGCSPRRDRQ